MEERIMDDEEARKIRLKRTKNGATDAVEDTEGADDEAFEEEILLELPDSDEYDEDLVGLTPSQLKEEPERRERAKKEAHDESVSLTQEAEVLLEKGEFAQAADLFAQAVLYDPENEHAAKSLWLARTQNFENLEPLYQTEYAEELSESDLQREFVLSKAGEALKKAREEYASEEKALAPAVESKLEERREAFGENLRYYRKRFIICAWMFALGIIAIIVSSGYILRTQSIAPIVITAIAGVLAFADLLCAIFFLRKTYVAMRLCRQNEKLSSTEDGARLEHLRESLYALDCILGKE